MHETPAKRGKLGLKWKEQPERDAAGLALIAAKVKGGAMRPRLAMTDAFQYPGRTTFTANGACALHWLKDVGGQGALCELEHQEDGKHKRAAYRLTPLGRQVRDHLLASAPPNILGTEKDGAHV